MLKLLVLAVSVGTGTPLQYDAGSQMNVGLLNTFETLHKLYGKAKWLKDWRHCFWGNKADAPRDDTNKADAPRDDTNNADEARDDGDIERQDQTYASGKIMSQKSIKIGESFDNTDHNINEHQTCATIYSTFVMRSAVFSMLLDVSMAIIEGQVSLANNKESSSVFTSLARNETDEEKSCRKSFLLALNTIVSTSTPDASAVFQEASTCIQKDMDKFTDNIYLLECAIHWISGFQSILDTAANYLEIRGSIHENEAAMMSETQKIDNRLKRQLEGVTTTVCQNKLRILDEIWHMTGKGGTQEAKFKRQNNMKPRPQGVEESDWIEENDKMTSEDDKETTQVQSENSLNRKDTSDEQKDRLYSDAILKRFSIDPILKEKYEVVCTKHAGDV